MSVDPVTLARAALEVAGDRPVLEVALELAGTAEQLARLLERLHESTRFVAVVESVEVEPSSTRGLVIVRARPDADPEVLRTDRHDTADGWGQVVTDRARRLVGHRVLVAKVLEDAGPDRRVRVLVWLDDLDAGARDDNPATAEPDNAVVTPDAGARGTESARPAGARAHRPELPPPPEEPA